MVPLTLFPVLGTSFFILFYDFIFLLLRYPKSNPEFLFGKWELNSGFSLELAVAPFSRSHEPIAFPPVVHSLVKLLVEQAELSQELLFFTLTYSILHTYSILLQDTWHFSYLQLPLGPDFRLKRHDGSLRHPLRFSSADGYECVVQMSPEYESDYCIPGWPRCDLRRTSQGTLVPGKCEGQRQAHHATEASGRGGGTIP